LWQRKDRAGTERGFSRGCGRSFRIAVDRRRIRLSGIGRSLLRFYLKMVNVGVGNLPAEVIAPAALLQMLFEEDGAARITYKCSRSGQQDFPRPVLHSDFRAQEMRIQRHRGKCRHESSIGQ
jgi:hypothetical protein